MYSGTSNLKISETAFYPQASDNVKYLKIRINWKNEKRKNLYYKLNTGKDRQEYIMFTIKTT